MFINEFESEEDMFEDDNFDDVTPKLKDDTYYGLSDEENTPIENIYMGGRSPRKDILDSCLSGNKHHGDRNDEVEIDITNRIEEIINKAHQKAEIGN